MRDQANFLEHADKPEYSHGVDCSNLPDTCRQEFKKETEVSFILSRYGGGLMPTVTRDQFGERDMNADRLSAIIAIDEAKRGYAELPESVRKELSFELFLENVNRGTFEISSIKPKAEEVSDGAKA